MPTLTLYFPAREALHDSPVSDTVVSRVAQLELLSNLLYTDKSFLNRPTASTLVRLVPVRSSVPGILTLSSCYCNFTRSDAPLYAAWRNSTCDTGRTNYFRTILRGAQNSSSPPEDQSRHYFYSKQIAGLLSQGPMITLKPQCVKSEPIIETHSADFPCGIRASPARPGSSATAQPDQKIVSRLVFPCSTRALWHVHQA